MSFQKAKLIEILLVEDNIGDIRLTEEALKESKLVNNLNVVMDGMEAIAYLKGSGKYHNAKRPDLILLDLNLPKKGGREVLKEIKEDEELKSIPVVILTTSKAEEDIFDTYEHHANCYITKPIDFEQFSKVVNAIGKFWFGIVLLPQKNDG